MKKKFRMRNIAVLTALMVLLGTGAAFAQHPVLKKKPVTVKKKVVVKPAPIPVYTVATGSIVRVRMNSTLSSKTAHVGQTFTTTVTEPVYSSNGVVVVPVGSTVIGRVDTVTAATKGGKPGTIDVRFTSLRLPNGKVRAVNGSLTDLDSKTASSDNEGTASASTMKHRKVIFIGGGAAGGAVLGGAIGGGKGALIGGLLGAGAGYLGDKLTKGKDAEVKSGTEFGVILNQSIALPRFVETNVKQ